MRTGKIHHQVVVLGRLWENKVRTGRRGIRPRKSTYAATVDDGGPIVHDPSNRLRRDAPRLILWSVDKYPYPASPRMTHHRVDYSRSSSSVWRRCGDTPRRRRLHDYLSLCPRHSTVPYTQLALRWRRGGWRTRRGRQTRRLRRGKRSEFTGLDGLIFIPIKKKQPILQAAMRTVEG